ncbi:hypothetical protein HII28_15370 [Planctomonas sp. JC2975]|uniref:hypothetical protein n=1 Tax=Planctomonas sp. JC2975 TaxID=2729626 RepID=UPI00147329C9|nr:hypothetical protein [Planctomonas sp. JC2975]NNC13255.1 hypothetical protein [Planctomonas sp. JC2975]
MTEARTAQERTARTGTAQADTTQNGAAQTSTDARTDPTAGFRRIAGAVALPLAFACQLACNTLYAAASTGNAGDSGSGEQTIQFYASHATAMLAATLLALLGCLLAVPGMLAALRTLRPARPRLALWAAGLMIAGYVCYFGIVFTNFGTLALAQSDVSRKAAGAALDDTQAIPAAVAVFLVFVVGNLLGTLLLGLAVILGARRTGIPWWSGLLIACWTVGHLANILGAGEWAAVGGGALEVVGLSLVAVVALRTPNTEWTARG